MLTEYQTYANMYGMEMEEFLQSQMGVTEEQLREAYRETATFRVKMTLAFHAIAEQEGLTVSVRNIRTDFPRWLPSTAMMISQRSNRFMHRN